MEKTTVRKKRIRTRFTEREIPKVLLYEEYDGKPVYYAGYKDVLNQLKTSEEIMGSSSLQSRVIAALLKFLYRSLDETQYMVLSNEIGLHLAKNSNLAADIAIYDKSVIDHLPADAHYFTTPPRVVIEVDIEADTGDFGISQVDYYSMKTSRLLDFGVQEVFWFFSGTRQVMIARPGQDWLISGWEKDVLLLQQHVFSLAALLRKDGLTL